VDYAPPRYVRLSKLAALPEYAHALKLLNLKAQKWKDGRRLLILILLVRMPVCVEIESPAAFKFNLRTF
jgi:hypothetical protein